MRIAALLTIMALMTTVAVADTIIYSEDFTSATLVQDPSIDGGLIYYPADFGHGEFGAVGVGTSVKTNASGQLVFATQSNGASRGAVTSIPEGDLIGAGNYTFSFDFVSAWNNAVLDIQVWNVDGAVPGNLVWTDVVVGQGLDSIVSKWAASTAVLTPLSVDNEYGNGALEGTTQTFDFNYDGTGDLLLVLTGEALNASVQNVIVDNLQVTTAIPEPATMGLFGLVGGAALFIRRRFSI